MPTSISENMDRQDLRRLTRRRIRRTQRPTARPSISLTSPASSSSTGSIPWTPGGGTYDYDDGENSDDDTPSNPHDLLIHALIENRRQEEEAAAARVVTPRRPRDDGCNNNNINCSSCADDDATPPQGARVAAPPSPQKRGSVKQHKNDVGTVDKERTSKRKQNREGNTKKRDLVAPSNVPQLHPTPLLAQSSDPDVVAVPTPVEHDIGYTTTDEDGVVWKVIRIDAEGLYWEAEEKDPTPAESDVFAEPCPVASRVDGANGSYDVTFNAQSLGFSFGSDNELTADTNVGNTASSEVTSGLVVVSVSQGSASALAHIGRGDRFVSVAGTDIGGWAPEQVGSLVREQKRPVVLGFIKRKIVRRKRASKAAKNEELAAAKVAKAQTKAVARAAKAAAKAAKAAAKAKSAAARAAKAAAKAKAAGASKSKTKKQKMPKIACPYCRLYITRSNGSSKGKYIRECMNDACPTRFFRVDKVTLKPSVYKNGHRGPKQFRYQFDTSSEVPPQLLPSPPKPGSSSSGDICCAKRKRGANPDNAAVEDAGSRRRYV